eukprot:jgi/Mesvir1/1090/Mv17602-RA.1
MTRTMVGFIRLYLWHGATAESVPGTCRLGAGDSVTNADKNSFDGPCNGIQHEAQSLEADQYLRGDGHEAGKKCRLLESAFRSRLVKEIYERLYLAGEAKQQEERRALLQTLYRDVALEADKRAVEKLYGTTDMLALGSTTCGDKSNGGGAAKDGNKPSATVTPSVGSGCLHYYEALAEHYMSEPTDAEEILPLCIVMRSQPLLAPLVALLLHRWLFSADLQDVEELKKFQSIAIAGASRLFWMDLEANTPRMRPIYKFFANLVVVEPTRLANVSLRSRKELVSLVACFYFFYEKDDNLHSWLDMFQQAADAPDSCLPLPSGETAVDFFVGETVRQVREIKVEPVLLAYLDSFRVYRGLPLGTTCRLRLQHGLYSFTVPGGPLYPPRSVRRAAKATLDCLYPLGSWSRTFIGSFWGLLHPYYCLEALFEIAATSTQAVYSWCHSQLDRILARNMPGGFIVKALTNPCKHPVGTGQVRNLV